MIPTVSYAAGIATYLVESRGLKTGLRIGSYLTGRITDFMDKKRFLGSFWFFSLLTYDQTWFLSQLVSLLTP